MREQNHVFCQLTKGTLPTSRDSVSLCKAFTLTAISMAVFLVRLWGMRSIKIIWWDASWTENKYFVLTAFTMYSSRRNISIYNATVTTSSALRSQKRKMYYLFTVFPQLYLIWPYTILKRQWAGPVRWIHDFHGWQRPVEKLWFSFNGLLIWITHLILRIS